MPCKFYGNGISHCPQVVCLQRIHHSLPFTDLKNIKKTLLSCTLKDVHTKGTHTDTHAHTVMSEQMNPQQVVFVLQSILLLCGLKNSMRSGYKNMFAPELL